MFSADEHIHKINQTEHGVPRMDAIMNAMMEADSVYAHEWRLYFRHEYLKESIFHGDAYKAMIIFPELLGIFDGHPELEDDYSDDIMNAYKWVIENMAEYYQITREELEKYYADMERRCRKYGYALRVLHMKKSNFYLHVDEELAKAEYAQYRRLPRDPGSDCTYCEANYDMEFALHFGDEEEALRCARPLMDGKRYCANVPIATYGSLCRYYLYKGDPKEAAYYGSRCEQLIGNDPAFLEYMGILLELYSVTNTVHGWTLLKQSAENFARCNNPRNRMVYARGAYRLMRNVMEQAEEPYTESVLLRCLPVKYEKDKGIAMKDLCYYFHDIARDLAESLDDRNGTDDFMNMLNTELVPAEDRQAELPQEKQSVAHGLVKRTPAILVVMLPEETEISFEKAEERLKAADLGDSELVVTDVDEILHASVRRDGRLTEVQVAIAPPYPIEAKPVAELDRERMEQIQATSKRVMIMSYLSDRAMLDYARLMRLAVTMFPELTGVFDPVAQHAYSAAWVRFAGKYPESVAPGNLFGLYLTGSEDSDEIWISTLGMNVQGVRDLEMLGATRENFSVYAEMLDSLAAQVTERGLLPDEGEEFGECYPDGETPYTFTWASTEQVIPEDSLAHDMEREVPTAAVLLRTDDGDQFPAKTGLFGEETSYPRSNASFYRRLHLAKATFGMLEKAAHAPFEEAAVRIEFLLDEETADKFGYGIELLWGDIVRCEDGKLICAMGETSEALPDLHEGDEVEVTADNTAAWFIIPAGQSAAITEQSAYLLNKEDDEK